MSDLVVIANFDAAHDASAAISFLESAGIYSVLKDEFVNSNMHYLDIIGSTVKVMVKEEDSTQAIQVLIDHGMLKPEDLGPDLLHDKLDKKLNEDSYWRAIYWSEQKLYVIALVLLVLLLLIFVVNGNWRW